MDKDHQDSEVMEGQLSIFDIVEEPKSIIIKGLCDDAHCPKCDYAFLDKETDYLRCPYCNQLVNGWELWHILND